MKNIFVKSDEEFDINIYIAKGSDDNLYASISEDVLKKNDKVADESIIKHTITFKRPTYKDNVDIYSHSVKFEGGEMTVNPVNLRYIKFGTLLKDWTFKDSNGEDIEANLENMNNLDSDLAGLIMDELEKITG